MLRGSTAIHRPSAARDPVNISLHDPELYYFLTLLAGIAALLAAIYDTQVLVCFRRMKRNNMSDEQVVPPPSQPPILSSDEKKRL